MKIEINVSKKALANLKSIVEENTGFKVTDAGALFKALLKSDCETDLESYTYSWTDGAALFEQDWPGLEKPEEGS